MASPHEGRRTLFVHVGPPKTGTSAIQHYLRSHETPGFLYPEAGRWADGAHHNLVFNYFEDFRRPEMVRENAEAIFQKIEAEIRLDHDHVLISSEALVAYDVRRFLDGIQFYLGKHVSSIEILFTYREHFGLAASLYNQRIKDPFYMERRDPNEFLRAQANAICYLPFAERLIGTGLKTTLVNYHPSATFLPRFLRVAGYEPDKIVGEKRNVSLSVRGMIGVLAANRVSESPEDRRSLFEALRKMRGFFAPSQFIFDVDTAAAIAPIFEEDRMRLQEIFGLSLPGLAVNEVVDGFILNQQDIKQIEEVMIPCGERGARLVTFVRDLLRG